MNHSVTLSLQCEALSHACDSITQLAMLETHPEHDKKSHYDEARLMP